jgi:lipopolysaccharide transport system permease protein
METLVIEAGHAERHYWRDLWRYRELFGFLAWRDILVRYKQTVIGVLWAVIRPLLTIAVGTGIFGGLAKLPSDGVPYVVMVCAGTLPWYFFSGALSESAASLVGNANLISKVYFPRLILPLSAAVVALVDFAISLFILLGLMLWFGVWPTWRLVAILPLTCLAMLAAIGPGLLFTALNVKYRDFRYVIPFVVQFGLFVTPVFYSSGAVLERFGASGQMVMALNPLTGVIDGFRWAVAGGAAPHLASMGVSTVVGLALLLLGVWYFRRTERSFADVI